MRRRLLAGAVAVGVLVGGGRSAAGDPSPTAVTNVAGALGAYDASGRPGAVRQAPVVPVSRRRAPALRTVTYSIAVRGQVRSAVEDVAATVASTFADARGWAGAGFEFVRIPIGGELVVWLSESNLVPTFGAPCDSYYSCRQGSDVIINDDRFATGSPYWPGPLAEYRTMVINHETGHWIGFGHAECGGPGQRAPAMMQQSKGLLDCVENPWPLARELALAPMMAAAAF